MLIFYLKLFVHHKNLIHGHILQAPLCPVGPAYNEFGNTFGPAQAQVAAEVFGGEVAAASMGFLFQSEAVRQNGFQSLFPDGRNPVSSVSKSTRIMFCSVAYS